jgi:putative membrane protein
VLPVAAFEEMRRHVALGRMAAGVPAGAGTLGVAPEQAGVAGALVGATGGATGGATAGEATPAGVSADAASSTGFVPARRVLLSLRPADVALYGLLEGRGLLIVAAGVGAIWEAGLSDAISDRVFGEIWTRQDAARWLAGTLFGSEGLLVVRVVLFVLAFGVLLALLRVVAGGWGFVRLYGFTLARVGDDLRTEYGLLTRVATTIPSHRVQTLTVREGPWHRLLGRAALDVETAGGEGEDERRSHRVWLAPLVRRAEVARLVAEAAPEADLGGLEWQPAHPGAFRRHVKKSLAVAALATLPTVAWLGWWSLAWLLGCALIAVMHARVYVRTLGWALSEGAVGFRSGWLWRQTSIARVTKVQAVAMHASPFDRRTGMARVRVDTAGASGSGHRVDIPYVPEALARHLHATLARGAAVTAFRW